LFPRTIRHKASGAFRECALHLVLDAGYPKGHTVKSGMTKVLDTGLFVSPAGGGKGVEGKAEDDRIIGLDIHLRHCVTPPPAEDTE